MEVSWIKLTTDMFDNRKIKHLRKLPDGNSIVLIWVMLLTMAGRCNAGGMVFLTETIPYTTKMLADELDFEENTVSLALAALENLGMIRANPLCIVNWSKYQNVDGAGKITKQPPKRKTLRNGRKMKQKGSKMCKIKPIETIYNGFRFRSRLEARWAVFFDAMGIKYEYEPDGYEFDDGTKYLPDFLIHVRHRSCTDEWEPVFAEVKGIMGEADLHKIDLLSNFHPVIVLGNLPADTEEYFNCFDETDCTFHSFRFMDGDWYCAYFSIFNKIPWICGADDSPWDFGISMNSALIKARQARFEHGECGAPK